MGIRPGLQPLVPGLDPSYVWAANQASVRRLAWGEAFVSTYGPWGYLVAPMDVGHHAATWVAAQLALVVAAGRAPVLPAGHEHPRAADGGRPRLARRLDPGRWAMAAAAAVTCSDVLRREAADPACSGACRDLPKGPTARERRG